MPEQDDNPLVQRLETEAAVASGLRQPNGPRKVFAVTFGWFDIHTPDNGLETVAATAARLEKDHGVKLHGMEYHKINHGYKVTFISDNITDIVGLCATDEGGGYTVETGIMADIFEVDL